MANTPEKYLQFFDAVTGAVIHTLSPQESQYITSEQIAALIHKLALQKGLEANQIDVEEM
ncbi:hypothetical protein [Mucilaginibacter lacusdianchii]|uniref:hypothetical protein n=1 Tax=Mucilaginibacter lacusdianchii TaxID=2684211 RepID=UPI00131D2BAC|nr:hypothetical protein [Mucilaginibacter sp. JXJ CY 39]